MSTKLDIEVKEKVEVSKPKDYAVFLINDDYTPMEFVVDVLMRFFNKNEFEAGVITVDIHENGSGLAGVFNFDIAETKTYQVIEYARDNEFPLIAEIKELD